MTIVDEDWRTRAACRELGPDLFFPTDTHKLRNGLVVCQGCPVIMQCNTYVASIRTHREGLANSVWAGRIIKKSRFRD